ncbi:DNA topoisomerase IV subunit B [Scrofimicrobium sp. R131]|uniref:DNA topoisomerase (ATP-hydrolyzing) n=1 Tax=Scrofimicrobium appendicitidis TaxID=3079930 RepID=A0AAU7V9H2_9ACTO
MSNSSEYTARHLSVLEGLEAVRKRPGMYIGSTDRRGLMHCVWEIIDNAVDEALEGHCDTIEVTLHPDHSVSVTDNGRGIPVDRVPGIDLSGVEVVFTKLHAGGKFGNGNYAASGGLHGVGASVVNALSARLDVEVDRAGKTYGMSFRRGEPGTFDDAKGRTPNSPFQPFEAAQDTPVIGKAKRGVTGTRVRFWHDFQIFPSSETFSWEGLIDRARQTAFLVPGLTIIVRDLREDEAREETFHFRGGVTDFVDFLAPDRAVCETWKIEGTGTYQEVVQQLGEDGHLRPVEVERTCEVECALRWGIGYDTTVRSFVNIIATPKGGTHLQGFEQGLLRAVRKQVEKQARKLKVTGKDGRVEKDDVLAGLSAVVTVRIAEPQFEGQTKEILGTPAVKNIVLKTVEDAVEQKLTSTKRGDKQEATVVLEKIVGEMKSRVSARIHKEISRRKTALETSTLPAKLADCRSNEVARSELFIVEGDSALGTAKAARSSEFQALFPIRGKILNTQRASTADMLSNAECANIIQVIGAGSGRTFDLSQARYGKVILMTDADVDGAHIRTLLLTLFFRYMRPLVEAGQVYAAVPPLHRIEVSARGKKDYIYTYSEAELHDELTKLKRRGKSYKEPIQRYKGLGEMDAEQLAETTMDPRTRSLRRITLADEEALRQAEDVFELLMGAVVAPRREFIVDHAYEIDRERIDA